MKKLFRISFLLTVLCLAAPAYAEGDIPTGNKTCTQNCGLFGGIDQSPTISDDKTQDNLTSGNLYSWIYQQISEILD